MVLGAYWPILSEWTAIIIHKNKTIQMKQEQLELGNKLSDKIKFLEDALENLNRERFNFLPNLNDQFSRMCHGGSDLNQFLPSDKAVKDTFRKNLEREIESLKKQFAAL